MTDKEKKGLKDNVISIFKRFNILNHTATIGGLRDDILNFIDSLQEETVSETNKVMQVRRCLEEVATTINPFIDEVIEQFNLKDKSIVAKEIQYRGVGLKGDFGENIHRSDDEVIYILKEDKTVGLIVIRRTEFNNAEITMVKTEERFKEKSND